MPQAIARRDSWTPERRFYSGMAMLLLVTVFIGFVRTFYLKPLFPEFQHHAPPESFFLFHGAFFTGWFILLAIQPRLVADGNLKLHRRLGRYGAVLAVAMVVLGLWGALIAAGRPDGFINVPAPPLQFLAVPVTGIALFAAFVALALARRHDPQSHKRLMLLASISLVEAAVARLPFDLPTMPSPIPYVGLRELFTLLFLLPLVIWDVVSRGRLHPATLWGGLALIVVLPLRMMLGATAAWQGFARWAVASIY
jgi:uncharacterized membrane protein YozB (DUF420 family)